MSWSSVLSSSLKRAIACRMERKKAPTNNKRWRLIPGQKKKKGDLHNPRNFGAFGLFLTVSHEGSLGMERSWQLRGLAGCCTLFPEKMLPRCVQPAVVQAESEDNTHLPCFPQPLHVPRVGILQEEWPSPGARWRDRRRASLHMLRWHFHYNGSNNIK